MVKLFTLLAAILIADIAHANCELSWIADWEAGKNWLHTTALRGDIGQGYQHDRKFRYSPPKNKPKSSKKVVQIEKIDAKSLSVVCDGIELSSCASVVAIEYKGKACKVNPKQVKQVTGTNADENYETTSDQYARQTLVNCLGKSFRSDIAVIDASGKLLIPSVTVLEEKVAPNLSKNIESGFSSISDLSAVDIGGNTSIDISKNKPTVKKVFVHPKNPNTYFAELTVAIDPRVIPNACDGECGKDQKPINLPVIVAGLNDNGLKLFGYGTRGQCVGGYKGYSETLATHLSYEFGLPGQYVVYDIGSDGTVDYIQITPRTHLPDTRYIYSLITVEKTRVPSKEDNELNRSKQQAVQKDNKLSRAGKRKRLKEISDGFWQSMKMGEEKVFYFEKEICVNGPAGCRPGASC